MAVSLGDPDFVSMGNLSRRRHISSMVLTVAYNLRRLEDFVVAALEEADCFFRMDFEVLVAL